LGSRHFRILRDFSAVADRFVGGEFEATKWISVKGCKAHDCMSSQSYLLIDIEESTAVVVIKEDIRGLPVISLWSTAQLNDSQLSMVSLYLNGWLGQFGAGMDPSKGFRVLNYANPENDGVSHLAPAPPSEPRDQKSTGTGFAISQMGHVLTNNHVVEACKSISLTQPGSNTVTASVIATDPQNDLAVVRFVPSTKIAAASFRSGAIKAGTDVAVFGYPLSDILAASGNIVTGNVTALAGMGNDSRMLQISAPVQPGNSGGPVLDNSGRVVAVVMARLKAEVGNPQNVNFAIKSSIATTFLEGAGVPFDYGQGAGERATTEVAELAQGFTYLISCQN
jgi:S1-C subfamily serine protease